MSIQVHEQRGVVVMAHELIPHYFNKGSSLTWGYFHYESAVR